MQSMRLRGGERNVRGRERGERTNEGSASRPEKKSYMDIMLRTMATAEQPQHSISSGLDSLKGPIFNSDDMNLVSGITVKGTTKFTTTCRRGKCAAVSVWPLRCRAAYERVKMLLLCARRLQRSPPRRLSLVALFHRECRRRPSEGEGGCWLGWVYDEQHTRGLHLRLLDEVGGGVGAVRVHDDERRHDGDGPRHHAHHPRGYLHLKEPLHDVPDGNLPVTSEDSMCRGIRSDETGCES
jgi:hypothetical protein